MIELLETVLGEPVMVTELKHKPGRRLTLRAIGSERSAIVKVYASDRAPVVASRLQALAGGPPEPLLPQLLLIDPTHHLVLISEVPGAPFSEAILAGDIEDCLRVGSTLGAWHRSWWAVSPSGLRPHPIEKELALLQSWIERSPAELSASVQAIAHSLTRPWVCATVVHRDLYEEQILLGERVGLIDLDDAALGPPELDLGNLVGHVELLGLRTERDTDRQIQALLEGYGSTGPPLDSELLGRCRSLTLLRLACIHSMPRLIDRAGLAIPALPSDS